MTRVIAELTERRLEGGGIYLVGRIGTARVRVQKSRVRVDDAGRPVHVWQVLLEPARERPELTAGVLDRH